MPTSTGRYPTLPDTKEETIIHFLSEQGHIPKLKTGVSGFVQNLLNKPQYEIEKMTDGVHKIRYNGGMTTVRVEQE